MATRSTSRRRYGKKTQAKVARAMHEYKHGTLKAGAGHHPKAQSRKQAIAIGLSEARKEGDKVPPAPKGSKSRGKSRSHSSSRSRSHSRSRSKSHS
jgi:hypothetical protein